MLNLRKKLLVSIFTLMLALVAVSTTTYAWFTMGNEVKVSNFEMDVKGSEGLAIRIERINGQDIEPSNQLYKWELDKDLEGNAAVDVVLEALTMLDLNGNQTTSLAPVTFDKDGTAALGTAKSAKEEDSPYLEITFGFRSEAQDRVVVFQLLQSLTNKDTHSFQSPVEIAAATDGYSGEAVAANEYVQNARAAYAVRLAYQKGAAWNVVDPQKYSDKNGYGDLFGTSVKYYNDVAQPATPIQPLVKGYTYDDGAQDLVTLSTPSLDNGIQYWTGSLTIRIWLEGWDSDCFNAVASDALKFNMEFKLK